MEIKYYKPIVTTGNIKCTVHRNGKLGFSKQAIKKLQINEKYYVKFGFNAENDNDKDLYLRIQDYKDEETFKINKAGNYFYVNTKYLFDDLNIDYIRKKVIFDIKELETNGDSIYKLNKRELERKRSKSGKFTNA